MWIGGVGTQAAGLAHDLGVPGYLIVGAVGAYIVIVIMLVILAAMPKKPARQLIAYRLLKALAGWWPGLVDAVRPSGAVGSNNSQHGLTKTAIDSS